MNLPSRISSGKIIVNLAAKTCVIVAIAGLVSCHDARQEIPEKITENPIEKPEKIESDVTEDAVTDATAINNTSVTEQAPVEEEKEKSPEKSIDIVDSQFAQPDSKNRQLYQELISSIAAEKAAFNYQTDISQTEKDSVAEVCRKIDAKLASVKLKECLNSKLRLTPYSSENNVPILLTEFAPIEGREPVGKVLLIGGTHGDELTSVSIVFKWIKILQKYHSGLFHWHIAPMMNPDGVLLKRATRANARGVDLNRNMPTPDWSRLSKTHWEKISRDPRKNPGGDPASEIETKWLIHEIESFQPDAIISVHAPYGILDFDGPDLSTAPTKFGRLRLNLLGTYPGSLGNYAGINKDIPVLTLELPHAWVMPKPYEINSIWTDMVTWLKRELTR